MRQSHWSSPTYGTDDVDDRPLAVRPDVSSSVVHGPPRAPVVAYAQTVPTLPGMPQMLPPEPEEVGVAHAALQAVAAVDGRNTDDVRAIGGAIRAITIGILLLGVVTVGWACAYWFAAYSVESVLLFWLGGLGVTIIYVLISEATGRKYTSSGVELEKVKTARLIHLDRLESRERMHAEAVGAWERTLARYLERF